MRDLLGQQIVKGDLVLINGYIYKVINSYSNTIKYTHNNTIIASTHMNEKVLLLNDSILNSIETIKADQHERIDLLTTIVEKSDIETLEEKRIKQLANAEKLKLKKETKIGALITDRNNQAFIYLGKSIYQVNNKLMHTYYPIGYLSYRNGFDIKLREILENRIQYTWHSLNYTTSLKLPDRIDNSYNDELINFYKNINTNLITNEIERNNIISIKNILNN